MSERQEQTVARQRFTAEDAREYEAHPAGRELEAHPAGSPEQVAALGGVRIRGLTPADRRDIGPASPGNDSRQRMRAEEFRRAVGAFPTGVCVITAEVDGRAAGMTLNSFASISLEPLLVMISLGHGARTLDAVHGSGRFAISVLHRGQSEIAVEFAARGAEFPKELVRRTDDGFLVVRHALAELACEVRDVVPAGDHDLVLAEVAWFAAAEGHPLVFHAGRFGHVQVDADAPAGFAALLDEGIGW